MLVTHQRNSGTVLAFLIRGKLYDCHTIHPGLPETAEAFIAQWENYQPLAVVMHLALCNGRVLRDLNLVDEKDAIDMKAVVWDGMEHRRSNANKQHHANTGITFKDPSGNNNRG